MKDGEGETEGEAEGGTQTNGDFMVWRWHQMPPQ
jgi:hypothetical protein